MKLLTAFTAGMVALTGIAAVPATAQDRVVVRERTVVQHRETHRPRAHRVCTTRWRHHQRVRTCRTVYRNY